MTGDILQANEVMSNYTHVHPRSMLGKGFIYRAGVDTFAQNLTVNTFLCSARLILGFVYYTTSKISPTNSQRKNAHSALCKVHRSTLEAPLVLFNGSTEERRCGDGCGTWRETLGVWRSPFRRKLNAHSLMIVKGFFKIGAGWGEYGEIFGSQAIAR
jgi:hypothetical protein